jgi:hypothetical protein
MSEALDLIKQRIEFTHRYHSEKENMAWLASTLFYGFCLAIISFLLGVKKHPEAMDLVVIALGTTVVFIGAMVYINLQFRMRWQANDWTASIDEVLNRYSQRYTIAQYRLDLRKCNAECERKRCNCQVFWVSLLWPVLFWRLRKMASEYRSEIPAYGIAVYLFLGVLALCALRLV